MKRLILLSCLCLVAFGATSSAQAQSGYPEGWDGIWELNVTFGLCGQELFPSGTVTDTICVGEEVEFSTGGEEFPCTGDISDSRVSITCTGQLDEDGCTFDYTYTLDLTRSGNSYAGGWTIDAIASGSEECEELSFCWEYEVTATRIGDAPAEYCSTPIEEATWGGIKSLFN